MDNHEHDLIRCTSISSEHVAGSDFGVRIIFSSEKEIESLSSDVEGAFPKQALPFLRSVTRQLIPAAQETRLILTISQEQFNKWDPKIKLNGLYELILDGFKIELRPVDAEMKPSDYISP